MENDVFEFTAVQPAPQIYVAPDVEHVDATLAEIAAPDQVKAVLPDTQESDDTNIPFLVSGDLPNGGHYEFMATYDIANGGLQSIDGTEHYFDAAGNLIA